MSGCFQVVFLLELTSDHVATVAYSGLLKLNDKSILPLFSITKQTSFKPGSFPGDIAVAVSFYTGRGVMAFAGPFSAAAMWMTACSKDSGSLTSPRLGKGCHNPYGVTKSDIWLRFLGRNLPDLGWTKA